MRERIREHTGGEPAEVRVVAPAADVTPLQWLASDEDEARAQAAGVARETSRALAPEADVEAVEAEVGDTDPVQAIEDALREFPAEELILVTRRGEDAGWLEQDAASEAMARFDLPITHLSLDED